MFKTLQVFFLHKNKTNSENPISIGKNCVKLQAIKEIQISRHMTIYGQTLGVFKRKNNECIRNGEKTKLHKIKIVVFWIRHRWCYVAYFVTNHAIITSKWRSSWRNTHHRPHILNVKPTILILFNFVFSPLRLRLSFLRLNTPKVWPYMVIWREIWISLIKCNFTPFYPIKMGFSSEIIEFYAEN